MRTIPNMIKDFRSFLLETEVTKDAILWKEIDFRSSSEKAVCDVAEETLLTKDLVVIYEGTSAFTKLTQIASTDEGEKVLEITGQKLYLYDTPFEFLKWEVIGSSSEPIETTFILSEINFSKLK
jgi:hypothetical protein